MCFKSKIKTPKVSTALPAPEPVMLEDPKGIDYGGEESGSEGSDDESTDNIARIEKDDKDSGDGTSSATALDKGTSKVKKFSYTTSSIKKNLSKKAKA